MADTDTDVWGLSISKTFDKKAYQKAYYAANRDKIGVQVKAWYQKNRDRIHLQQADNRKAWRQKNRDWIRTREKAYREANRDKRKTYEKAYYAKNPHKRKSNHLKWKYGLSLDQFNKMFDTQGCKCAICRTSKFGTHGPVTDHCHDGGHVRGILCSNCNSMIGHGRNSTRILASAIKYLSKEVIFNQETQNGG
jgi:hypothetical protein